MHVLRDHYLYISASYQRLSDFSVHVSNDSDATKHDVLCAYHRGYFAPYTSKTLTCPSVVVGRYVSISIRDPNVPHRDLFALCEVVVMGNSPIGASLRLCSCGTDTS
jgi:hypothetical protein